MDMYLESRKEPMANLETARSRGITVYSDDRIAFIDSLQNIGTEGPIRLDAFIATSMENCMKPSPTSC